MEKKEKTKEKIGRSPDDADALALCHHETPVASYHAVGPEGERDGGHFGRVHTGGDHFGGRR